MEENLDNEIYFEENNDGSHCFQCGKFFDYDDLQLYRRTEQNNKYICLNCVDVFQD